MPVNPVTMVLVVAEVVMEQFLTDNQEIQLVSEAEVAEAAAEGLKLL
jgi:hypothetical protein